MTPGRLKPTPKVTAAGVGGVVTVLVVWVAELLGATLPAEPTAALVWLLTLAAGYAMPDQSSPRRRGGRGV